MDAGNVWPEFTKLRLEPDDSRFPLDSGWVTGDADWDTVATSWE